MWLCISIFNSAVRGERRPIWTKTVKASRRREPQAQAAPQASERRPNQMILLRYLTTQSTLILAV